MKTVHESTAACTRRSANEPVTAVGADQPALRARIALAKPSSFGRGRIAERARLRTRHQVIAIGIEVRRVDRVEAIVDLAVLAVGPR